MATGSSLNTWLRSIPALWTLCVRVCVCVRTRARVCGVCVMWHGVCGECVCVWHCLWCVWHCLWCVWHCLWYVWHCLWYVRMWVHTCKYICVCHALQGFKGIWTGNGTDQPVFQNIEFTDCSCIGTKVDFLASLIPNLFGEPTLMQRLAFTSLTMMGKTLYTKQIRVCYYL